MMLNNFKIIKTKMILMKTNQIFKKQQNNKIKFICKIK